jgi:hypothetical protein
VRKTQIPSRAASILIESSSRTTTRRSSEISVMKCFSILNLFSTLASRKALSSLPVSLPACTRAMIGATASSVEDKSASRFLARSMEPPTRPKREEAADAGSYGGAWGQRYPRMQLARKVAKNRVISTVDFEARHGHKVRLRFVTAT